MACAQYIESDVGRIKTVTSTTRPTGASRYVGQLIYESDTFKLMQYQSATTGWTPPWNLPWGLVTTAHAYATLQSSGVSGSYLDTGSTLTFTAVQNRRYRVGWQVGKVLAGGVAHTLTITLTDSGGTPFLTLMEKTMQANESASLSYSTPGGITFSPGSTVIKTRATSSNSTSSGFQSGGFVSYLWVEDIGPSANPA